MPLYSSDPNPAADAEKARAEERRREEQEAKERERRRVRWENRRVEEGARARQLINDFGETGTRPEAGISPARPGQRPRRIHFRFFHSGRGRGGGGYCFI